VLALSTPIVIAIAAAAAVVFGILGFILGLVHKRKSDEGIIISATEQAKNIVNDAMKSAEAKKKEAILEAKDEVHKLRSEADREIRERRNEVQRQERRMVQKEESLDKKIENLEAKEEKLAQKSKEIEKSMEEAAQIKRSQLDVLERISGFSIQQAKDFLLKSLEDELTHEKALKIQSYEQQLKDEKEKLAANIIAGAIQRCAADHSSESTISVVDLPNDDMKGRIIGREGRNIRALETLTGVDLIIDDTPEAITLSSFDPIRREVARVALEKLILDGRIHPARIEENAVLAAGVRNLHPELVQLLGRLHYRTSYGQNVLNHSLEVAHLSGLMAAELGENVALAKRAGLLHDIGKALDHEHEGTHIQLGVEAAKKYNESEAVIHAIHAHHGDVEAKTVIACLVQAADAISAARPGARRENIENYVKRLEQLEEIANSFNGVESSYAIQAGREVRIMVKPDKVSDDQMIVTAREIVQRIESEMEYPGQIKVQVVRESRAIDYAK
jgi:ribonuclease Y